MKPSFSSKMHQKQGIKSSLLLQKKPSVNVACQKQQQKQICISITKILNWQIIQDQNRIKFEISFYSQKQNELILCKNINGISKNSIMYLNSMNKIKYTNDQFIVIVTIGYSIGSSGKNIIGDFKINLEELNQKNVLKFTIKNKKSMLIIEKYQPKYKTNSQVNQNIKLINTQLLNTLTNIKFNQQQNKTQHYIQQKQQFLQRFTNKSQSSSRTINLISNKLSKQVSSILLNNKKLNSLLTHSQRKSLTQEVKPSSNCNFTNIKSSILTLRDTPHTNNNNILIKRKQNFSQDKKLYQKPTRYAQHSENKTKTIGSRQNQQKQKYILIVNSMNVIPYDQYYQTQAHQTLYESKISSQKNINLREQKYKKTLNRNHKQVLNKLQKKRSYLNKQSEYF